MTPAFTELDTRRLGPVRRYFLRRPVAMDVVVMALFALPALLSLLLEPVLGMHQDGTGLVIATALALTGTAALYWRRRRPVLVSGCIGALGLVCVGTTGSIDGFDVGLGFMVYAVAASRPARTAWLTLLTLCVVLGVGVWLWEAPMTDLDVPAGLVATVGEPGDAQPGVTIESDQRAGTITSMVMIGLIAMAIGSSVRNRRLHVAELVARGNALARERDQQAQLVRAAERSRIAREMHDVVAHSLSVMIALADGAGAALDRAPDRSRAALDELSETGRSALADMRRVLGVLHEDAPSDPQPGSPDLADLVERFRTAGLGVRTAGLTTELPEDAGFRLAVYRVVQEALTNALRHAPGTPPVELTLRRDEHAVTVEVQDHGPAVPVATATEGSGRGLIGMRERAGVYGGAVEAGPWLDGWRVRVTLPWEGPPGDGGTS